MNIRSGPPVRDVGRTYLLVLAAAAGAAVLALEVLGTRVIGTYCGGSLYVWAALLIVTLSCLAVGYALGGKLADRRPSMTLLCLLVILAGLSVLLAPAWRGVLAPLDRMLGLVGGAIVSAAILFALPLILLAMTGPYVIRLRAANVEGVGSTSGAVYAFSTVGSVLGVLAVSLWMIPHWGTTRSLLACSATLVVAGAAGLTLGWGLRGSAAILLLSLPWLADIRNDPALAGELHHAESAYGDLRVIQRDLPGGAAYRMLLVNGIMQTGMPVDAEHLVRGAMLQSSDYYLELLPYFHPDLGAGRKGILIGLAGGMFTRVMEHYDITWTAVEIDVKAAELAKAYFGYRGAIYYPDNRRHEVDWGQFSDLKLRPGMTGAVIAGLPHAPVELYQGKAVIQDGRQFLARQSPDEPVDFIVLDAYNSDTIPFHLVTREFFELVKSRLTGDGILAINFIGRPEDDFVTNSLLRTLTEVFGSDRVQAYSSLGPTQNATVQVITIFALRQPMELAAQWPQASDRGVDRVSYELEQRRLNVNRPTGMVLTDDRNPIDLARARVAMEWRRQTQERLAEMP